jgi:MFS family permease
MAANGIGALMGALFLAKLGDFQKKGMLLIVAPITFSVALILFSYSLHFWLSFICLIFAGWGGIASMATINTILQLNVPDELRGRVLSMFMLTFTGLVPMGNLIAGALAQQFGVQVVVFSGGMICFVAFSLISLLSKQIRLL